MFDELPEPTQEKADTRRLMLNINIMKLGKTPAIHPGIHAPAVSKKIYISTLTIMLQAMETG